MFRRASCFLCTKGALFDISPSQKQLQDSAQQFSREVIKPAAAELDRTMVYPQDIFKQAWELGFVNMHIPESVGGLGLGCLDECVAVEELAWGCSGVSTAIEINSIASAPLLVAGTSEQKKKYLGRLTEEPLQAAYCVTEPNAGSDVAGIKCSAEKCGDHWILNGTKMWVTNGGVANWFFVLARAPEGFVGLIVDGDAKGVTRGPKEINLGQRCSDTRTITFDHVQVPLNNTLGDPKHGFKIAMKAFDFTRPPVAMAAVGVARRAMEEARDYALQRKSMGVPIAQHQSIAFMLAEMASGIEAGRLLVYKAAAEIDAGRRNTFYASIAKQFAADHCQRVCTDALQIFGGAGYNTEYPMEKLYRDCKIFQIYEGTSQIQKLIVSRFILDGKK